MRRKKGHIYQQWIQGREVWFCSLQAKGFVSNYEPQWLLHVDFFMIESIQKLIVDIKLLQRPHVCESYS